MQIDRETKKEHTIQAYDKGVILVNNQKYQDNFLLSHVRIISPWALDHLLDLNESHLDELLLDCPKIVLMGHEEKTPRSKTRLDVLLSQQGIGIEYMSIGAACRTFNILLAEDRPVVAGFIFRKT